MADSDASTGATRRVLTWLRGGNPTTEAPPPTDDVAPLPQQRGLAPEEIESIASDLSAAAEPDAPISEQEIVSAVHEHTQQSPDADAVRRVRAHLAMGGWPLEAEEVEVAHETTPDERSAGQDEDPEAVDPH